MITTQINLTNYLAEYLSGKYYDPELRCVHIPDSLDLYHTIWDLLQKRPVDCPADEKGNIVLALPDRRTGKDPAYYNYLGIRSIKMINKRVENLMYSELFQLLDENKNKLGTEYLESVYLFKCKYCIESISDDGLLKRFQRWRELIRQRKSKRKYRKNT